MSPRCCCGKDHCKNEFRSSRMASPERRNKAGTSLSVDVKIFGRHFTAPVDTSRTNSVINRLTAKYVCQNRHMNLPKEGDSLRVDLKYKSYEEKLRCVVIMGQKKPILLGMDFVEAFGLSLQLGRECLKNRIKPRTAQNKSRRPSRKRKDSSSLERSGHSRSPFDGNLIDF